MFKKIGIFFVISMLVCLIGNISIAIDDFDSYVAKADEYFVNTDYAKALEQYGKAIVIKPKELKILSQLSYCYFYLNDLKTSLDYLIKISEINDKYPELHFRMAYIYESSDDFDKAIEHYNKAVVYNDNKKEAYFNLGIVYGKRGDLKISIQKLREAIKLGKNTADVHYLIAATFDRLGYYAEAIKEYLSTYSIDKKNAQVFYQIGIIKKKLYRYGEAISFFNKFLNLSKDKPNLASLRPEAQEQIIQIKKAGLPKGAYIKYSSDHFDPFNFKVNYLDEFTPKEIKYQGKIIAEFSSLLEKYKILISMLPMKKDETIEAAYLRGWGWDLNKKGMQDNVMIKNLTKLETKNSMKFEMVVKGAEEGRIIYDYFTSVLFVSSKNYDKALFEIIVPIQMIPRGVLNNLILSFKVF